MCNKCKNILENHLNVGGDIPSDRGLTFKIDDSKGDKIYLTTHKEKKIWFHKEHLLLCLHWLLDGLTIEGVAGSRNSIRGLIGENGILISCNDCDLTIAYIWEILLSLPEIQFQNNYLKITKE